MSCNLNIDAEITEKKDFPFIPRKLSTKKASVQLSDI